MPVTFNYNSWQFKREWNNEESCQHEPHLPFGVERRLKPVGGRGRKRQRPGQIGPRHCGGYSEHLSRRFNGASSPPPPPALAASAANALVSAGSGKVVTQGATTTVTQTSQRLAIDWLNLSTTANEALVFKQPNAQAIALNRITGSSPSNLLGSLTANGQVFILNPNGVLFGAGAQVNVGSLVASTLRLDNTNFMAGNYQFAGDANGSVINQGTITVAPGGTLALMAPVVQNTGTLSAPGGSVLLAGAQGVSLTLQPEGGLVAYTLDSGSAQAMVDNGGLIQAGGGHVVLTAKGVDAMSKAVVNHSGVIEAQTVGSKNGVIELLGDMQSGTVNVSGKLDASAPNADGKGGDGGFIETSAAMVKVADTAQITTAAVAGKAGTWLIDPLDITINSGLASTISTSLNTGNVTISTAGGNTPSTASGEATGGNGDIFVNSAVNWSANKLTLSAGRYININANLNASGTAKLTLEYGLASADGAGSDYSLASGAKVNLPAGQNFSTKQGTTGTTIDYTVITSLGSVGSTTGTDLQGISGSLTGNFALGGDIDATLTLGWANGAGFSPIGSRGTPFSGMANGLGHFIKNLTINRPTTDYVGLFGGAGRATSIKNIRLDGGNIRGGNSVGALVGDLNDGRISDSYSTINVEGSNSIGGLIGAANMGTIVNSYATGNILATGNVAGGLIGYSNSGLIVNSYATGNVGVVGDRAGGLVGSSNAMTISTSFATGNITANGNEAGGLVGYMNATRLIDGYATGSVSGIDYVGGISGRVVGSQTINSYSTGSVGGTGTNVGGFLGYADPNEIGFGAYRGYWNITTSGLAVGSGGTGLTTTQMQTQSTYTGWDFVNTWRIVEGSSYPMLRALTQGKIILASARDIEKVYDKTAWSGGIINYSGFTAGDTSSALQGTIRWVGTAEGAINAGNYSLVPSGLYSQKYEVVYVPGTLTIQPRPVDVSVAKTYNGNSTFTSGFVVSNGVLAGDTVNLSGSATVSSANAGSYAAFSSNNLVSSNPNYTAKPQYVYTGALGKVAATIAIDPAIEAARLAAIAAAAEADRLAAIEAARVAELARQAAIVAEQARLAEVLRLAREGAAAEAARLAALEAARVAEVARQAAIVAEQARLAEVIRLAREAAKAEADRVANANAAAVLGTMAFSMTPAAPTQMYIASNVTSIPKIYTEAYLKNLTLEELKNIQKEISNNYGWEALPNPMGQNYRNALSNLESQRTLELENSNVVFASYADMLNLGTQVLSASMSAVSAAGIPNPIGRPSGDFLSVSTRKFKELANNDLFMRGLDSAGAILSEPGVDSARNLIFGGLELADIGNDKVMKVLEAGVKIITYGFEKGFLTNTEAMKIFSTIADVSAEFAPPGVFKIAGKAASGIFDTWSLAVDLQTKSDEFVVNARELINIKYDLNVRKVFESYVIDSIQHNQTIVSNF